MDMSATQLTKQAHLEREVNYALMDVDTTGFSHTELFQHAHDLAVELRKAAMIELMYPSFIPNYQHHNHA